LETVFFRLLKHDDKPTVLAAGVESVRIGTPTPEVFTVDPSSFGQVPGSPFAYWVSERVRRLFKVLPLFESEERKVKVGDHPGDSFRFLRLFWEVPCSSCTLDWRNYQKGGDYSTYYYDVHLVVDWDATRQTYRNFYGRRGRANERPSNYQFFFLPGLAFPARSQKGLSIRIHPKGCIFSHKGPVILAKQQRLLALLGLTNSAPFKALIALMMAFGSFEVGVLQRAPVPDLSGLLGEHLADRALICVNLKRDLDCASERSHIFHLSALLRVDGDTLAERIERWQTRITEATRCLTEHQREIDDLSFRLYEIDGEDRRAIEVGDCIQEITEEEPESLTEEEPESLTEEEPESLETAVDSREFVADLIGYSIGSAFGRWDISYATGARRPPDLPDPFDPLPVCSTGMLTGSDGLPAKETPPSYPLCVEWDGILVDDPDHASDIVRRVRGVLELIWKDRAETIEKEACKILGVKELRDYCRKPGSGGFWDDHVKRYSKSRRKAPIYWLLQSPKKNYAIWLYYHRLGKDILFKALVNYVEPKVKNADRALNDLRIRRATATGKDAKNLDRQIEKQDAIVSDLRDFEDRVRRAANLHLVPDLNDGVVLTIAPLWELVPWKEAKAYWEELRAGKYEWSSIAKQMREKGLVQ
jgi:hypothetical protein